MRVVILGGVLAAVLVAGCGGSSQRTTTHVSSTTTPVARPSSGLESRVLRNNELPGFTAQLAPVQRTARQYLTQSNDPHLAGDIARLTRLGFKGAVSENLTGPGQEGLSLVEQLGSDRAARSEVTGGIQHAKSLGVKFGTFPVRGIPGAVGYSVSAPQGAGINIAWAAGHYYYQVGETLSALNRPSEHTLNTAARSLYHRLSG